MHFLAWKGMHGEWTSAMGDGYEANLLVKLSSFQPLAATVLLLLLPPPLFYTRSISIDYYESTQQITYHHILIMLDHLFLIILNPV